MTLQWLKKPIPAALALVAVWLLFHCVFLLRDGLPTPDVADGFSYVLGADTLAHGRLVNPAHPLAAFFESPHELVRPVYATKYQPGQSMFLALGQVLFGKPFYGVLIGDIFMIFAFTLMLYAWVPSRAALIVSIFFALVLSPGMYWTTDFYGGAVAAGAAALVLLAIGQFRKRQTALSGAVFALGVLLLYWTRPYEGGVFTLAVLAVFAREIWRNRRASMFAASLVIVAAGGAWSCYYDQAITGNPFLLPYVLHDRQYEVTPVFWFQPLRPEPHYSFPRLAAVHGLNGLEASDYRSNIHGWRRLMVSASSMLDTLEPLISWLLPIVLLVPLAWDDPLFQKMAIVAFILLVALSLETYQFEHYTAPAWAVAALLIAIWTDRALRPENRRPPLGIFLALLLLVWLATPAFQSARAQYRLCRYGYARALPSWKSWAYRRAALIHKLSALNQPQLVLVRYPTPEWRAGQEWVYNSADIDRQRVVFAYDLGADKDKALLDYYPDRTVWLLTFDAVTGQEKLNPYPQGTALHN